jgi:stage IV sporulation protein FB
MRDVFGWSFPLARWFGIQVRIHLLFPLITLGLILRVALVKDFPPGMWVEMVWISAMLFIAVLLHEFGHCFAARSVDGEATEILMWPLGGLAFVDVPHNPRAHFITTIWGPLVNLILCGLIAAVLVPVGLIPPLNPLRVSTTTYTDMTNWRDGLTYGSTYLPGDFYTRGPAGEVTPVKSDEVASKDGGYVLKKSAVTPVFMAKMAEWQTRLGQFFWINWFLFWLNVLLVGFPLDGGRLLQSVVWARTDYRQGTTAAIYGGYVVAAILCVYAFVYNEVLPLGLAMFVYFACWREHVTLTHGAEESPFGYDFSQGYTSLERDDPPPRVKRPNFVQRWLQRRAARKLQKEIEQRELDERRLDELLDKVHRLGKESLTAEERRFMERVSSRYKNK